MTTFSQLVDSMVLETRRPDLVNEIATYLNQTIRELHFQPDKGDIIFYRDNLKEGQVTAQSATTLNWSIPNPTTFQAFVGVRFDSVFENNKRVWARELSPGFRMETTRFFYYRTGSLFTFSGFGGLGATISLAWYEYPRKLKYYGMGSRPAEYDSDNGWNYGNDWSESELNREAAQQYVTNWILMRWETVVEEGLRAKVYKRLSDTDRARTSYSMYTTLRQGLYTSEVSDFGKF